jgi:malate synthase
MTTPSALTELDAVNVMLSSIGEAPITNLDATEVPADVPLARQILSNTSREVQSWGWRYNSQYGIQLLPDGANGNKIIVPSNYFRVQVDPASSSASLDLVQRGTYLFDRKNNTDAFTSGVTVVATVLLDFPDLPQVAREYITIRASRQFADRVLGDQNTHMYTTQDEYRAKALMDSEEAEVGQHNIFNNWSIGRILLRRGPPLK